MSNLLDLSSFFNAFSIVAIVASMVNVVVVLFIVRDSKKKNREPTTATKMSYPASMRSPLDELIRRPLKKCEEKVYLLDEPVAFDEEITKVEPRGIATVKPPKRPRITKPLRRTDVKRKA